MDDAVSAAIHFSYFYPSSTIGTAHLLLLYVAWAVLIVSWILACIRETDSKLEDEYNRIERALITKRATAAPSFHSSELSVEHKQACSICQTPFQENDLVSWSSNPQCYHVYHHICLKRWLLEHYNCPSCRQSFHLHGGASSRMSDDFYFCIRDGLQQVSYIDDERARCVPAEELKAYRDAFTNISDKARDANDDSLASDELLQSYGRHMRLPPRRKKGV